MKNPLTLDAFADWLEKQPAEREYEFWCKQCAIGRYFQSLGLPMATLGIKGWEDTKGRFHSLPARFTEVSMAFPRTYGAAAKRARAIVQENV